MSSTLTADTNARDSGILKDGFDMGRRENLTGSGLRRSAGGWEGVLKLRRTEEYWRGDEYWLAAILK